MASFDLSKLSELDEQITKVLNDMAVSVGVVGRLVYTSIGLVTGGIC